MAAARPKSYPGSLKTLTLSGEPMGETTIRSVACASSIRAASALGGKGHPSQDSSGFATGGQMQSRSLDAQGTMPFELACSGAASRKSTVLSSAGAPGGRAPAQHVRGSIHAGHDHGTTIRTTDCGWRIILPRLDQRLRVRRDRATSPKRLKLSFAACGRWPRSRASSNERIRTAGLKVRLPFGDHT